jgi:glycosyltransferase involved in cell wall biosynthesis
VTRVVVLPSDESACGLYRMRFPAGAVMRERPDWRVELYRPSDVKMGVDFEGNLQQVQGIPRPNEIDLLVMQRVATKAQSQFVKWVRSTGAAVVTDSDDAMWCIDKENTAHAVWNGEQGIQHFKWLEAAADEADLTTVTTKYLEKRYGAHGRCEILPNCVPADLRETLVSVRDSLDQTPTVGWAGFTATHPNDLKVCGRAVAQVQEDTGCIVRVVGDAPGAARDWGMAEGTVEMVQPTAIGAESYTALTTLDIGLVPLADTPFNRGKSYLKALEYAACGVAVVASPTQANLELSRSLPIAIARNETEWYDEVQYLIQNPDVRQERVAEALDRIAAYHTYEVNAELWISAWERAMRRRKAMAS